MTSTQHPSPPVLDMPADLGGLSLQELDELIDRLVDNELVLSHRRRLVHRALERAWAEREHRTAAGR